jgi:hypothetical protein
MLESRRVHGKGFGITITKENINSPMTFHLETGTETNTTAASTIAREDWFSKNESKEIFYSNLQLGMAVSWSRYLPIGPITQPSLDGTHTSYLCMFPENWKADAIFRFIYMLRKVC